MRRVITLLQAIIFPVILVPSFLFLGCSESHKLQRFESKTPDTVYDKETKLTWQKHPSGSADWYTAKKICQSKGDGWRLPSIYELMSLTTQKRQNPAIVTNDIDTTDRTYYWSATTNILLPEQAWIIEFQLGTDIWYDKNEKYVFFCVQDP